MWRRGLPFPYQSLNLQLHVITRTSDTPSKPDLRVIAMRYPTNWYNLARSHTKTLYALLFQSPVFTLGRD
jgi:hypothetical protein